MWRWVVLFLLLPAGLEAQGFRLQGRVFLAGDADSVPVASTWVVLHHVSEQSAGPVDSARTDAFGAFSLRAPQRDTTALYLASVLYRGTVYISDAVSAREFTSDTVPPIVVYDTASVGVPLTTSQRDVVVELPGDDGLRTVIDIVTVINPSIQVRVPPTVGSPSYVIPVPQQAFAFEVEPQPSALGNTDFGPDNVTFEPGQVNVLGVVRPGIHRIVFSYQIPAITPITFAFTSSVDTLQILLEDPQGTFANNLLSEVQTEEVGGRTFVRYRGTAQVGEELRIAFPRQVRVTDHWWAIIVVAVISCAVVLWRWRRRQPVAVGSETDMNGLLARIALLDRQLQEGEVSLSPDARTALLKHRQELKQQVIALTTQRSE